MRKLLILIIVIIFVGLGYWLLSPLFIDKKISEQLPPAENVSGEKEVEKTLEVPESAKESGVPAVSQGKFSGQGGHEAEGTASLIRSGDKLFIRLEDDFKAQNGPDLFVHLGKGGAYNPKANLGALKGNIGSQNYEIPESIKIEEYDEVWVWCRAFSVPFARAVLK